MPVCLPVIVVEGVEAVDAIVAVVPLFCAISRTFSGSIGTAWCG